jgi:hypothetical protein
MRSSIFQNSNKNILRISALKSVSLFFIQIYSEIAKSFHSTDFLFYFFKNNNFYPAVLIVLKEGIAKVSRSR